MADLGKVLGRLGAKKVKQMDDAAKRMSGMPGYDDDTLEALKELETKKSSKEGLTAAEERAYDRLTQKAVRAQGAETEAGMAKKEKAQKLTAKEKEEMQKSLAFKKGGMVKKKVAKYAKGGAVMANCGASVKPNGGSRNK
jgi:uncharacterized protein YnzC (UPF0291/DUF896 family)